MYVYKVNTVFLITCQRNIYLISEDLNGVLRNFSPAAFDLSSGETNLTLLPGVTAAVPGVTMATGMSLLI